METDTKILSELTSEQQKAVGFLAAFTKRMATMAFSEQRTIISASNLIKEVYQVTDQTMTGCIKKWHKAKLQEGMLLVLLFTSTGNTGRSNAHCRILT